MLFMVLFDPPKYDSNNSDTPGKDINKYESHLLNKYDSLRHGVYKMKVLLCLVQLSAAIKIREI